MNDTYAGSAASGVQPTATEDAHTIMVNSVSWGAIFAGVVVALVVQVLLTMLGMGIGLATVDVGVGSADNPSVEAFSITSGIWFIASGLVASFVGGYIASRMSGRTVATTGALHGLTTWAFTTLLVLWLLSTSVGALVGGALSGVAGAIGGLGQTVAQTAGPALQDANPLAAIERQVAASGTDPQALNAAATNAVRDLIVQGENAGPEVRQQAAQALANARQIPVTEAEAQVDQIVQQYQQTIAQARTTATETADAAASVVSTGALVAFAALVLGAIAGWFGGRSGVVHPVIADRLARSRPVRA